MFLNRYRLCFPSNRYGLFLKNKFIFSAHVLFSFLIRIHGKKSLKSPARHTYRRGLPFWMGNRQSIISIFSFLSLVRIISSDISFAFFDFHVEFDAVYILEVSLSLLDFRLAFGEDCASSHAGCDCGQCDAECLFSNHRLSCFRVWTVLAALFRARVYISISSSSSSLALVAVD